MKQILSKIYEFMRSDEVTDLFLVVIGSFTGGYVILTEHFGLQSPEIRGILDENLGKLLIADVRVVLAFTLGAFVIRHLLSFYDDAIAGTPEPIKDATNGNDTP